MPFILIILFISILNIYAVNAFSAVVWPNESKRAPPGVFDFKDFFIVNWMMTGESHIFLCHFFLLLPWTSPKFKFNKAFPSAKVIQMTIKLFHRLDRN